MPNAALLTLLLAGCDTLSTLDPASHAGECVTVLGESDPLTRSDQSYDWIKGDGEPFTLQAADLSTYLLYDTEGGYVVASEGALVRQTELDSDLSLLEDGYVSGALWELQVSERDPERYLLWNRREQAWMGRRGLTTRARFAERVSLEPAESCLEHPEASVDATGEVGMTTWEDGDLYGAADAHSHLMTHLSFGGFMYHGATFHPLGVEHALMDCDGAHGEEGRVDFFGYVFDGGGDASSLTSMVGDLARGELSEPNHATEGWPTFTDWPDATSSSTHQVQYYRWLERAWMGGLRLVVQHATSNAVICNLTVGEGLQPARYDCEDMTAVDRILDETWALQDYIDAQSGGPGEGWFRIVTSPEEARDVISQGKMAVLLGIETSDLFNCHLTPREGGPVCDDAYVLDQLDRYHERGVRVLFPVHKYDNAFSPGDGSGDFIEVGNFINSGHYTNMVEDCPEDVRSVFDGGDVTFSGLLEPRDVYQSEPPYDMSLFPDAPLDTMLEFAGLLLAGPAEGDYCQNGTLTDQGETLLLGMMERGMLIELDHLPQWSYVRAFELLEEHDYPALGTHGGYHGGRLYELGGFSTVGLGRCHDPENPGSSLNTMMERAELSTTLAGYANIGFGFDLNGFAHARGPRFGERGCGEDQVDPVTYPFESYSGDVTFTQPYVGERAIDFNTEGMVHIGLFPELIEDARKDAVSDADLEPLFRSAEAYVRMWELAEARAAEMAD